MNMTANTQKRILLMRSIPRMASKDIEGRRDDHCITPTLQHKRAVDTRIALTRDAQPSECSLEELADSLEELALEMLSEENRLYVDGRHQRATVLAEWRGQIRAAAEIVSAWLVHAGFHASNRCPLCPRSVQSGNVTKCKWHI